MDFCNRPLLVDGPVETEIDEEWKVMAHKYGAKKTVLNGITFDSKREAERYWDLKQMERMGLIKDLELQPKFVLWAPVNIKAAPMCYVADFRYKKGEKVFVEDVKGVKTEAYKIKAKMFRDKYPEIDFQEVS